MRVGGVNEGSGTTLGAKATGSGVRACDAALIEAPLITDASPPLIGAVAAGG